MTSRVQSRLPAGFIFLDLVGTLLILAGALERFGPVLPEPVGLWVAGYGWTLIISGVFCVLVAGLSLVRHIQTQRSSDRYPGAIRGPVPTVERRARQEQ
ncbi:MAG: hypothetical protein PVJ83_05515 [Gammaproteobacteria bacterium]|jgi:hypothetical protein